MKVAQHEVLGSRPKEAARPGRDDRRLFTLMKPHTRRPGTKTLLSSLPGRTSLFALFPSTSYWATFIESLRDDSSRRISSFFCCRTSAAEGPLPCFLPFPFRIPKGACKLVQEDENFTGILKTKLVPSDSRQYQLSSAFWAANFSQA
jgi:hypothetical protein